MRGLYNKVLVTEGRKQCSVQAASGVESVTTERKEQAYLIDGFNKFHPTTVTTSLNSGNTRGSISV